MSWSTSLPAPSTPAENSDERWLAAKELLRKKLAAKWQLVRVLGVGATSSVFEAVHNNGHRVAIKVLHRELAYNTRVRQRFLREGYLANRVGHPAVVAVIDDGITKDGTVFLVLELLTGESLSTHVVQKGGRLETREVLHIAHEVLDVLDAAHRKGIIHRDIKPANVFLTDSGTSKVLDFGLARLCDVATDVFQSGSGGLLGTPAYMAPEQARGAPGAANAQTDLWCLGATMFRLLAGRTVHSASTVNQLIIATATEAALPLCTVAPWVPAHVGAIVDRALKLNPNDRWTGAAEMKAAVAAALTNPDTPFQSAMLVSVARVRSAELPVVGQSTLPEAANSQEDRRTSSASFNVTGARREGARSRTPLLLALAALGVVGASVALLQDDALAFFAPTAALRHWPSASPLASLESRVHAAVPTDPGGTQLLTTASVASLDSIEGPFRVEPSAESERSRRTLTRAGAHKNVRRPRLLPASKTAPNAERPLVELPDSVLDSRE
ncbi:MAG TPA: serine/threonine-protein kinase [Polyangiaceae bacterium]|nr:serine/threonine-protein kinase [Polyangiaceae bacterium]